MEKEKKTANSAKLRAESAVYSAAQLFLQRRIEDVKMTDIAQASGIGVASLYRWFGTKETLVIYAGALLWRDLGALFENIHTDPSFREKTGYAQIEALFGAYRVLFRKHADFIRFIADFDDYALRAPLNAQALAEYEKSILNFYPHFLRAFQKGLADGSIRKDADPQLFYDTVNHAMMALSQKLLRGEILGQDRFGGSDEPDLLLTIALSWLAAEK